MTTTPNGLKPEVARAIEEIRAHFPDNPMTVKPDGNGGAFVTLDAVPLSPTYQQADTWVGFQITFQYPYADVYPHFVRPDLSRADNRGLGDGTGTNNFDGRPAIQLSRRNNHLNPAADSALIKLLKVLEWLRNHL